MPLHRRRSALQGQPDRPRRRSERACSPVIPLESVADHVLCGICSGPVASSLVLSCSHLFCGDCLSRHLAVAPSCPTCNMDLRAVPVRCLAVDRVAEAVVASMTAEESAAHARRKLDGASAADRVNKMFWHLAPPVLPGGLGGSGVSGGLADFHSGMFGNAAAAGSLHPHTGGAAGMDAAKAAAAAACGITGMGVAPAPVGRGAASTASNPMNVPGACFGAPGTGLLPPLGCVSAAPGLTAPGAPAGANSLLQLAVAAQQMVQVQQHMANMQQMAAVLGGAPPGCRPLAPDVRAHAAAAYTAGVVEPPQQQQGLLLGAGLPAPQPGGLAELQQLSRMMGGMCQV